MRVVIVGGANVDNILKALENEKNLDVLGCKMVTDLNVLLKSSGQVDKIILFDKGINLEPEEVVKVLNNINTIIIMNKEEDLQNMSVETFGNKAISLVNNRGANLTLFFLKEMITCDKVRDDLIYKPKVYGATDEDEEEEIEQEIKVVKEEIEEPIRRVIKEEERQQAPAEEKERKFLVEDEVEIEAEPERKTSVVKDKGVEYKEDISQKDAIVKTIKLYGNSCVIGMAGTGNSGTTTMVYNMGCLTASLGLTTLLLDLDFRKTSLSYINKELFYEINDKNEMDKNEVMECLADGEAINHGYLVKENLMVVSQNICCDIEQIAKYGDEIQKVIQNARKNFDVIFIDTRLGDINRCPQIVMNCDRLIYTVQHKNKPMYELMRELVNINNPEVRKKVFKACVIWMGKSHGKGCLYSNTDKLECIDELLNNKFGIVDELKFADMIEVGTIPYIDGTDELIESRKTLFDIPKVRPYFETLLYNILQSKEVY